MSFESNGNVLEIKNADKVSFLGSGGIVVPSGTAAQQPTGEGGMTRFNTTTNKMEFYEGAGWRGLDGAVYATGGAVTEIDGYRIHTFTTVGNNTFIVTNSGLVEYLIVAGGGGGGSGQSNGGGHGGGGGGGVLTGTMWIPNGTHNVIVGDGGNGGTYNGNSGSNGDNSSFMGQVAFGGGGGEGTGAATRGLNGGSGGGGGSPAYNLGKGFGLLPQGADGADGSYINNYTSGSSLHRGGGGGGAGRSPVMPAAPASCPGGDGRPCSITGSQVYYGGGGGASGISGNYNTPINSGGAGGLGGGGSAGISPGPTTSSSTHGTAGTSNTGGGGGGGGYGKNGGAGGSGIVIIRYLL